MQPQTTISCSLCGYEHAIQTEFDSEIMDAMSAAGWSFLVDNVSRRIFPFCPAHYTILAPQSDSDKKSGEEGSSDE